MRSSNERRCWWQHVLPIAEGRTPADVALLQNPAFRGLNHPILDKFLCPNSTDIGGKPKTFFFSTKMSTGTGRSLRNGWWRDWGPRRDGGRLHQYRSNAPDSLYFHWDHGRRYGYWSQSFQLHHLVTENMSEDLLNRHIQDYGMFSFERAKNLVWYFFKKYGINSIVKITFSSCHSKSSVRSTRRTRTDVVIVQWNWSGTNHLLRWWITWGYIITRNLM